MKLILLGSGSSEGVPVLGCKCDVCSSGKPRNKRYRQSLYIESTKAKLLIDPGVDLKHQFMDNNLSYLDAALVTHSHFDHIGGLNDVRAICSLRKKPLPLYSDEPTFERLYHAFGYLFKDMVHVDEKKIPAVSQNVIELYREYKIGDITFEAFAQNHGGITSLGFKFKDFVYSTDLKGLNDQSVDLIKDKTDLWFVDCLGYGQYRGHFNLDETLYWIKEIRPKKAILIHMSHHIDYYELSSRLPKNVVLGHDNMTISI